ncbi:MAG TPA: acetoacetate decarboxylase family protein [Nocardioides sp.]
MITDLLRVPGVPETALSDSVAAALPENLAPAPWSVRSSGTVWFTKAPEAATDALPGALRAQGARATFVIGGFVRYEQTPVGAYDETFGVVGYRIGRKVSATVAFMAVDSPTSVVGGRANWAMPKALAEFEGSPRPGDTFTVAGENDLGWRISATSGRTTPKIPVFSRARVVQEFPDGSLRGCRLKARGWARMTRTQVEVESASTLPDWLVPGRHPGATLEDIRFSLGVPEIL